MSKEYGNCRSAAISDYFVRMQHQKNIFLMATWIMGVFLDSGIGMLVFTSKLPIYFCTLGTLLVTVLISTPAGVGVAIASSLLSSLLGNHLAPYYTGTSIALAVVAGTLARKGFFYSFPKTVATGVLLSVIATAVNVPITAVIFGGFSGTGLDFITAVELSKGYSVIQSVLLSNFFVQPLDKVLQCLIVFWLIQNLPQTLKRIFRNGN